MVTATVVVPGGAHTLGSAAPVQGSLTIGSRWVWECGGPEHCFQPHPGRRGRRTLGPTCPEPLPPSRDLWSLGSSRALGGYELGPVP